MLCGRINGTAGPPVQNAPSLGSSLQKFCTIFTSSTTASTGLREVLRGRINGTAGPSVHKASPLRSLQELCTIFATPLVPPCLSLSLPVPFATAKTQFQQVELRVVSYVLAAGVAVIFACCCKYSQHNQPMSLYALLCVADGKISGSVAWQLRCCDIM